jgi:hypothetical protein
VIGGGKIMQTILHFRRIAMIAWFLAAVLFLTSRANAGSVWLIIAEPQPFPQPGKTFKTDLKFASWEAAMSAFAVVVHYDPNLIQITEISVPEQSNFRDKTFSDYGSYALGATTVTGFQVENASDQMVPAVFATITWRVVGGPRTSSTIQLEPQTIVDISLGSVDVMTYAKTIDIQADSDEDGLPDDWEQQIVEADLADNITTINDVLPGDDFDGDGENNLTEYINVTDPTDRNSVVRGDVDGDKYITLADAIRVLQVLTRVNTGNVSVKGDVNQNGRIGIEEAIYILQYISGLR